MNTKPLICLCLLGGLVACDSPPPKPSTLHYKVSGPAGTPVLIEYYGTAVRPGDRRFARDLIVREVRIPSEGYIRFWGAAEADGHARMTVLNKDPAMQCVEMAIEVNDKAVQEAQACLKSYATTISAVVPALSKH